MHLIAYKKIIKNEVVLLKVIGKLNINKLDGYKDKLITNKVILTKERLNEHILVKHKKDYEKLGRYLKNIVETPDYIIEDNKHKDTIILLKNIKEINQKGRVVIKLALLEDDVHIKNSIITLMKLNERTWRQTIINRGKILWQKNIDKYE